MFQNVFLVIVELSKDVQVLVFFVVFLFEWNFFSVIFNNVMILCVMLFLLLFIYFNFFLYQRIFQFIWILGSLVVILLVFLIIVILVKVQLDVLFFFVIIMIKIVFINLFGVILQGSLFGLVGFLFVSYMVFIMSGQGLVGFFVFVVMICVIVSGLELLESVFGYFIIVCVVIILIIICYLGLFCLEFYCYYQQFKFEGFGEQEIKLDFISKGEELRVGKEEFGVLVFNFQFINESYFIKVILKNILVLVFFVCFIFIIIIGMFLVVIVEVKFSIVGSSIWECYFIFVFCFLIFNIFDWLGWSFIVVFMWFGKDSCWLLSLVLVWLVFVLLLLLCNIKFCYYLIVVFEYDVWFIFFMVVFVFFNGYFVSFCMCFGFKKVKLVEVEIVGVIMVFFLCLGLVLGVVFFFLFWVIV